MVPTFIIEEHHEAFFIWHYAVIRRIIPNLGNTLLHVDAHSDMNLPTLSGSLKEIGPDLKDTLFYVWNNLGISEFILPAVYQGLFNKVYWMQQKNKYPSSERRLNVVSYKGEGCELFVTNSSLNIGRSNPDCKSVMFHQIDTKESVDLTINVILDIDLDYFFCDYDTGETFEVEITENEYKTFCKNPYHRLHMTSGGKLRAEERIGTYYYIYQPKTIKNTPEFNAIEVMKRIEDFASWLQKQKIKPMLIDICRSRFSGYTPSKHWQWIEEYVLNKIEEIFPISVKYLPELLKENGIFEFPQEFEIPN